MLVNDKKYRTIWYDELSEKVKIIDQRFLPFDFVIEKIEDVGQMCNAIADMHLRGAGLIGAAGAWGIYLSSFYAKSFSDIEKDAEKLLSTRPTAVNLQYAIKKMLTLLKEVNTEEWRKEALALAQKISDEDADSCKEIGINGYEIIKDISSKKKGGRVNILTHCNAGWLAFVDYGSALAPIYKAFDEGIDVHVYVDETRPRNQGARLTAWELNKHGVPHTLIVDNLGGHLMQHDMVDMVIVGSDRVSRSGDVANKIGTYLKALAAVDNSVPFYVAFPSSTYDKEVVDGLKNIPIEQRSQEEVLLISGLDNDEEKEVLIAPHNTQAINFGFDVTPSRYVTKYITEKGCFNADELLMGLG